jgi:hypothetical protein
MPAIVSISQVLHKPLNNATYAGIAEAVHQM